MELKEQLSKLNDMNDECGIYTNILLIEEMSELTKEITKTFRGSRNRKAIIEESSDVLVTLFSYLLKIHATEEEIKATMNEKITRAIKRLS